MRLMPTHQVRHICKAHKANSQKPTLQKSLPCSYASGTHSATVDTLCSLKKQDEGRTHNMGFAKMGADGSRVSTFCFSIWLHIQQDVINLAMYKSSAFIYKFSFS